MKSLIALTFAAALFCLPASAMEHEFVPQQICCLLEPGADIEEVNARWGTYTLYAEPDVDLYLLHAAGVQDMRLFAKLMMTDPDVHIAEPNYHMESPEAVRQMVIAVIGGTWEEFADQDAMNRIGLDSAHDLTRGAGVKVAVLDTGVDFDHEAFAEQTWGWGRDYVDDDQDPSEEQNGLDDDEDGFTDEGFGHGTMVAGLVALIAPEAEIMPMRVLGDEGIGTEFNVVLAIVHSMGHGANVLNMSFGAPIELELIRDVLQMTMMEGGFVVCGAGNGNQEFPPLYPAADQRTCMIAALDSMDIKADFSDFHQEVLVSAPGAGIRSAYPGGEWGIGSGCSFATPMVSAEAALILSLHPYMHLEEIEEYIMEGVDPIYHLPENFPYLGKLGSGRINLYMGLAGSVPASVEDLLEPGGLHAWPNPSDGWVSFRMSAPESQGDRLVQIHDLNGRLVREIGPNPQGILLWDGRDGQDRPVPTGAYWARPAGRRAARPVPIHLLR